MNPHLKLINHNHYVAVKFSYVESAKGSLQS